MKTLKKTVYCSRCGDQLSPAEMLHLDGSICAFCEHIRAEALEIHSHAVRNYACNAAGNLKIVNRFSDNSVVENLAPLP